MQSPAAGRRGPKACCVLRTGARAGAAEYRGWRIVCKPHAIRRRSLPGKRLRTTFLARRQSLPNDRGTLCPFPADAPPRRVASGCSVGTLTAPTAMPPSPAPADVLARARELVAENREAEAAGLLERIRSLATDALHREIALRAAAAAIESHAVATAIAWLERGLIRNPADTTLNFFRGRLHLDAGQTTAALDCLRRAVAADPRHEEAALACASALLAEGAASEAASVLAGLPDSARAQLLLAEAAMAAGNLAEARLACERARRLQPGLFEPWFALGRICARSGALPNAVLAFTRAVALRPTSVAAHLALADTFVQLDQAAEARRAYAAGLRLDPTCAAAHAALARLATGSSPGIANTN